MTDDEHLPVFKAHGEPGTSVREDKRHKNTVRERRGCVEEGRRPSQAESGAPRPLSYCINTALDTRTIMPGTLTPI